MQIGFALAVYYKKYSRTVKFVTYLKESEKPKRDQLL